MKRPTRIQENRRHTEVPIQFRLGREEDLADVD